MALRETARGAPMSHGSGATSAIRRIQRELKEISESPSRHWTAAPASDDLFEWQFAVRGPPATDFEGGIYTGRLVLPVNYPLAPPSITLLTPNGRWEVGKKICLSNTSYHPDLWQPAWGIRTMMEALRSHFPMPGDGAIGAIDWPSDLRKRLAKESLDFVCHPSGKHNRELLPELSPEEQREDMPEPLPLLPPTPVAEPGLVEGAAAEDNANEMDGSFTPSSVNGSSAAVPGGMAQAQPVAPPSQFLHEDHPATSTQQMASNVARSDVYEASPGSQEGLRQRHAAEGGTTVPAASSSSVGHAPRRRREGGTQRRPQQSFIMQILKPPRTGRRWVLFFINILIGVIILSFLSVLIDILKNPPRLLDPLPETKE